MCDELLTAGEYVIAASCYLVEVFVVNSCTERVFVTHDDEALLFRLSPTYFSHFQLCNILVAEDGQGVSHGEEVQRTRPKVRQTLSEGELDGDRLNQDMFMHIPSTQHLRA